MVCFGAGEKQTEEVDCPCIKHETAPQAFASPRVRALRPLQKSERRAAAPAPSGAALSFYNCASVGYGTGVSETGVREILKHSSDRHETLPKRVSNDSRRFVFRRRKFRVEIFVFCYYNLRPLIKCSNIIRYQTKYDRDLLFSLVAN